MALGFLKSHLDANSECRPDLDKTFLNPVQTPSIRALYNLFAATYAEFHKRHGDPIETMPLSEDHFRKLLHKYFPNVSISKTNKFAQCDVCYDLKEKINLASGENKQYYIDKLQEHQENVMADKIVYYTNR